MHYKYQFIEFSQAYEGREEDYTPYFTDDKTEARGLSKGFQTSQRPNQVSISALHAPSRDDHTAGLEAHLQGLCGPLPPSPMKMPLREFLGSSHSLALALPFFPLSCISGSSIATEAR